MTEFIQTEDFVGEVFLGGLQSQIIWRQSVDLFGRFYYKLQHTDQLS